MTSPQHFQPQRSVGARQVRGAQASCLPFPQAEDHHGDPPLEGVFEREGVAQEPDHHSLRRQTNATLRRIARLLVPLNYAKGERFDHDPALKFGILPRLEPAASLASLPDGMKRFAKVGLTRELNKVRATLRAVQREITRP